MGANRYSIQEQTPGRFRVRWYDDAGKRRSKAFGSRTEAKRFLNGVKADLDRGEYIDPSDSRRTVREVGELWLESRNLRPKTKQAYRTILDQRIYPTFGDRPVGGITTLDIVAWITYLSTEGKRVGHNNKGDADPAKSRTARDARYRERKAEREGETPKAGLAPGTVHNAVRVMNQVLGAAVRSRYLRGNPCDGLTREDLPRHRRGEVAFLSAPQVARLASAVEEVVDGVEGERPEAYRPSDRAASFGRMVRFAAQTGLRAGEVSGLRWENVDLLRGRVNVAESISTLSATEFHVVPPKNGQSRWVSMTPGMTEELRAVLEARGPQAADYVWPGDDGEDLPMHWGRDFYLRYWKRAAALAGLPDSLRFHDLRHTCAALLIAANVPAKAIQVHLGHSSFKITMDTYGHLYADATDLVSGAMANAFTTPTESSNVRQMWG
ncbi:tyrosine-type recombinase/integrase [Dietzia kunjamensis]|uniref:tyrosine-type recombinase/integrase n=1 Tax=Dietzia kunjamensis TaxID=322509 RepID=UPI0039BCA2D3